MGVFSVIFSVRDDKNKVSTTEVNVPDTFSLSQYGEFATAMATLVQALLQGQLLTADLCMSVDISGLTGNVETSASTVDRVGAFQYSTALGNKVSINVPALGELLTTIPGSDDLDFGNANTAALNSAILNGIAVTGGTIQPCDIAENDIVVNNFAREASRPSARRKGG